MKSTSPYRRQALLIVILLVAAAVRTVALTETPPGLYLDEAVEGYDAFSLWYTGYDHHGRFLPITLQAFNDYRGALFSYLLAPIVGLGGLSVFNVRLLSSLLGTLVVAATYRAGYELLGNTAARRKAAIAGLSSAALLAISPWHVHFSRIAIETNPAALSAALTVIAFARLRRTGRGRYIVLAAVSSALGLYTYAVMKLVLPVLVGGLVLISAKRLWHARRATALAVVVGLVLTAPMLSQTIAHPELQDHFAQISIFQPDRSLTAIAAEALRNLAINLAPGYLFISGSPDRLFHPQQGGQLHLTLLPLLLLGLGITVVRRKSDLGAAGAVTLVWLLSTLIPACLTQSPSGIGNPQRTLPAVVPWHILGGIGLTVFSGAFTPWIRRSGFAAIALALAIESGLFFNYYVRQYPREAAAEFHVGMDDLVHAIDRYDDDFGVTYFVPYTNDLPYIHVLFFSAYSPVDLQADLPETDPQHPDRVTRLGKIYFTEQAPALWNAGLPGLYVLPQDEAEANEAQPSVSVDRPYGLPGFEVLGRPTLPIGEWHSLAQCSAPVVPLTDHVLDQVTRHNDGRRIVFDCTQGWIFPGDAHDSVYALHRDARIQDGWLDTVVTLSDPLWELEEPVWQLQPFGIYRGTQAPSTLVHGARTTAPADSVPERFSAFSTGDVSFDGGLTFVTATLVRAEDQQGLIEFTTTWRVTEAITRAFSLMAHVITPSGEHLGTADGLAISPLELQPGDILVQRHRVSGLPTLPQELWLRTGAYWLDTLKRWRVDQAEGDTDHDAVFIRLREVASGH